jgi:8-oxo-dGTP pyrophosphatase MutT (NUDIX family)
MSEPAQSPAHQIIDGDESADLPPARPAATLVVFDEQADGPPRLLMVRRSTKMLFAGGAVVFPGGRVDDDDRVIAMRMIERGDSAAELDDLAARVAAIRETLEETGLLVGAAGQSDDAAVAAALRGGLSAGAAFSALLEEAGVTLDLAVLTPFARWNPKLNSHRRFDTRFYIAKVQAGRHGLTVDGTENSELFWASAAESLAMAARGEIEIIFPTRRNLERLATYADFVGAVRCATIHPVDIISPWIEHRPSGRFLVIPRGLGYPVTEEQLATAARG